MKLGRKKSSLIALFSLALASTMGGCGGAAETVAATAPGQDAGAETTTGDPILVGPPIVPVVPVDSGSDDSDDATSSADSAGDDSSDDVVADAGSGDDSGDATASSDSGVDANVSDSSVSDGTVDSGSCQTAYTQCVAACGGGCASDLCKFGCWEKLQKCESGFSCGG